MIRSMTGYGRAGQVRGGREITIELRSVNNRYLDCTVKMPHLYLFAEDALKKAVQRSVSRGKVDVFVTVDASAADTVKARVNRELAERYVAALQELSEIAGTDLTGQLLTRFPDALTVTQVVVPLSEAAAASPLFSVPVFDPARGAYVECAAPPLSLRVVPRLAPAPATVTGARERAAAGSDPRPGERVRALRTAPARLAPAETALRLFDLPAGSDVLVRARHGEWARVLLPDGASGWIPASLLAPSPR